MEKKNYGVRVSNNVGFKSDKTYSQRITIHLTNEEISNFNAYMVSKVEEMEKQGEYIGNMRRIVRGENLMPFETLTYFVNFFGLVTNMKIKVAMATLVKVLK